jgi:hypothetical protein
MDREYWFADRSGNRRGPVEEREIANLIAVGTIGPDTLIWTEGMVEWRVAGQVEPFSALFGRTVAPPLPQRPASNMSAPPPLIQAGVPASYATGSALVPSLPVWGLFWRSLVVGFGALLVIPTPWTNVMFYAFLCEHVALPNGARLRFAGQPGDIWWVFILSAVLGLIGQFTGLLSLLILPFSAALSVLVIRWFCLKLTSDDGRVGITFEGGVWPFIGWTLLLVVSFLTIIGWAWVIRAMLRWLCGNVRGAPSFRFNATGSAILGYSLLAVLGSIFIIPIPWIMRWYTNWYIAQFSAV